MAHSGQTDPIDDDEVLLRRIPKGYFDPNSPTPVMDVAFRPRDEDTSGISLWREKYREPASLVLEVARPGKQYYVARVRAGDLRRLGVEIVASEDQGGIGHVSLTTLDAQRRPLTKTKELIRAIATHLILDVLGPYETPSD